MILTQLFKGGYEEFQVPPQSHNKYECFFQASFQRKSMLEELTHYLLQSPTPPGLNQEDPSLLSIAYYPLRIIAAEWVKYIEVMSLSVKQYEDRIDDIPCLKHTLVGFEADLKHLQSWRRRTLSTTRRFERIVKSITSTKESDAEVTTLLLEDYRCLISEVNRYGQLLNSMLSVIMSMVQIIDSRQSIAETANITRLTYLALAFVPLSFVSSLCSMSNELAPGGEKFWLYFVVAIPLTLLVFALVRLPLNNIRFAWTNLGSRLVRAQKGWPVEQDNLETKLD